MIGPTSNAYVSSQECFRLGDLEMLHQRERLEPDRREEGGVQSATLPGCPQSDPFAYIWGNPNIV